ncbi:MAG: prephenate dehydratase [Clostridia bacterium]|nr:prephenate dehydratase [Clostridia bacterium]MEE1115937.1 prephenate dehydratase [Clostridia bacterium]
MEIKELRNQIDKIDEQLVELFKQRMGVSARVTEYKREHNMPVLDATRERELLARISTLAGEDMEEYARVLYATILDLSRSYQHKNLCSESVTSREVSAALENTSKLFPTKALVACQGVEGAYSQIAAEKLFRAANIVYFNNFEGVFSAIEKGMCKYGVLPLENSTAGSVNNIYDLMIGHNFKIVRSVRLKIDHNLLAKRGTSLSDIKEIFSHEQAIHQSEKFLKTLPGVKVTVCANTAMAAKMVSESDRTDVAALSSRYCAEQYGLDIIESAVQDNANNYTRFICISKDTEIYPGADRTSVMMVISHKPGSLYRVLSRFFAIGINLTKLESRPIPNRDFEFMFYFDIDASVYSPQLPMLFAELETSCEEFRYLGTYSEII